jgi:hypothetical protein
MDALTLNVTRIAAMFALAILFASRSTANFLFGKRE